MLGNDSLHASLLTCLPLVLVFCVRWRRKRWMRRWRRRMTTPGVTVGVGYHDEAGTLCTLNNAVRSASSSMFSFSSLFVVVVVCNICCCCCCCFWEAGDSVGGLVTWDWLVHPSLQYHHHTHNLSTQHCQQSSTTNHPHYHDQLWNKFNLSSARFVHYQVLSIGGFNCHL